MIDVCLLGTGGMMPLPRRFLTALLVRVEGSIVLIDCGEATQVAIHLSGFSPASIDHILITHFHGDHVSGLPGLLLSIANNHRTEPLHIWGGQGLSKIVKGLTVICEKLPFPLVIHELPFDEPATFSTGELTWRTQPVRHRVPCLAYRADLPRKGRFDAERAKAKNIPLAYWRRLQQGEVIEAEGRLFRPEDVLGPARQGIRLTYATDCRPSQELVSFAEGSDLFIAEGLYGDPEKQKSAAQKGHMVFEESARLARDAGVKELWLTHYSPAMMNPREFLPRARAIFPNTQAAKDLFTKTLVYPEE